MPGPAPNRSDDYSRPRDAKRQAPVTKGVHIEPSIPKPDKNWHPICTMFWEAVQNSGQSYWYQESDWVLFYSLLDDLSKVKKEGRLNGNVMSVIYTQLNSLGLSEGERRRMRIELDREFDEKDDAADTATDFYKGRMTLVPDL